MPWHTFSFSVEREKPWHCLMLGYVRNATTIESFAQIHSDNRAADDDSLPMCLQPTIQVGMDLEIK